MSDKVKVSEIAKELGINAKEVIDKAAAMGLAIKAVSSSVSMDEAEKIMNFVMSGAAAVEPVATKPVVKKVDKETKTHDDNAPKVVEASVILAASPVVQVVPVTENSVVPTIIESAVPEEAPKRSGLKIVKKARPVEEVAPIVMHKEAPAHVSSYGKLSADVQRELEAKKAKKTHTSSPTQRKDQGTRLDIFAGDISDVSMDYDDEQVVLLDFSEIHTVIPEE